MTQFSDFDLSQMDETWQIKQSEAVVRTVLKRSNRLDPPCNFLLCLLQMLDFLKTRFRRGQQRGGV